MDVIRYRSLVSKVLFNVISAPLEAIPVIRRTLSGRQSRGNTKIMRVGIISNTSWSIYNFREALIKHLVAEGYEVFILAPDERNYVQRIEQWGCKFITLKKVSPKSKNPISNIEFYYEIKKVIRQNKLDLVYSFTPKPNIWGSIAGRHLGVPFIPTINGLGHAFVRHDWLAFIVVLLYRYALRKVKRVIFQNPDDINFFIQKRIVRPSNAVIVAGSGIDLDKFNPSIGHEVDDQKLRFLYAGRLIKEKGIIHYLQAAAVVKKKYPNVTFQIIGSVSENPSSIQLHQLQEWIDDEVVTMQAHTDNMAEFLNEIDVVVLPSYYREGIPKILIEACAKELPIITTNCVGCNQAIKDGYNGYVVQEKNVASLIDAMEKMIKAGAPKRAQMGRYGRKMARERFDEKIVINEYLGLVHQVVKQ
jgi:glycosyltransferase involved in cell wall biosynthesis